VTASVISDKELEKLEQQGQANQDKLLCALLDIPGSSLIELAEHLGWRTASDGKPNKSRVYRVMVELKRSKLVEVRRDGHYILTKKGLAEAKRVHP
jgi:hypothetical protein